MTSLPPSAVLVLASAVESAVAVALFPQHLPEHPLLYIFVRLLGVQTVAYAIYSIFIWPFFLSPLRHLPGPKSRNPIIGHGMTMFEKPAGASFLTWLKTIPNDGLIHFRAFLNADRVLVADPKALQEILVTKAYEFEKPEPLRNFLRFVLGDGLIIVEGDSHKFLRKNLMPVFSFRHIKELYPIFWSKSTQMIDGIAQQVRESAGPGESKTSVVEINHWATKVTVDIIGLAAMGRDFQALKNSDDPLIQVYEELLEPTMEKQVYFVSQILGPAKLIRKLPLKLNERSEVIVRTLTDICLKLVREKKELIKTEPADHKDILSLCIRSNNFSDEQLVDQLLTFLAAGHETTSSALTWTCYLLAKHPEIQTALREEIHRTIPSPNQPPPSDTDLAQIFESAPLLNGVCNESIRLYPTVPITVRINPKPTTLAGHVIPKNTQFLLSPWAINRNPAYWGADADEFTPYRWIDTDEKTGEKRPNNSGGAPSNYAILTFLHGPRSCIGQGFAKAELRCLVAAIVGSFEMTLANPEEKVVPHGVVTTKPKNGMHLVLKPLGPW
ncbi:uncharacterized protein MYCFIDRAFT_50720 [Pseudocercospora fijiensis CIRAD86]|uniref:Cytochrome P450 monooxygenase n=1 Tax=Pseudocercospora fijiensis (strain CIRAD86) TaxID=383855 RepID=M2YKA7_PSEFD|nr:uncharacterized protein MYCFIDRAFT_50720 [Pseudocercospora fijiensis CIRAD86]EME78185.1 hypothetical protein MYCFIDRAFT_50720 [Pseudocercospora fijiensis CIRAD86]